MQAKNIANRKAISMTHDDCLLNDNVQQFKDSTFKQQFLEDQRWAQKSGSSPGIRLPTLLILLFLLLIVEPSSVLAVPVHNCSAARYRHVRHVKHGKKNAIKPGSLVSFTQPSSASNLGFLEKSTSTVSNAPTATSLSVVVVDTTSATTIINQRPPIRPNTRTNSVPILVSVPAITASTLALSDPITSTPTLHPISIPIGTIIPSPPKLTLPPHVTVTNSASNVGVLWRSSSTSSISATSQRTTSPAPTSTPSTTTTPMPPDQHKYIVITIVSLSAIALIGLVSAFCILRYYARRRRARGPRREVELVEVIAPRCAQAVRDDLLNRRATVDGGAAGRRNSLDDILAASGRINASARAASAAAAYESSRATSAAGGAGGAAATSGDEERRSRRLEKGGGSGEDGKGEGGWETLPPYVPR